VKLDARAELEGQRLAVVTPLPFSGEFRRELQVGCDVDELVAQGREHDAANECACAMRVEHVGVVVQADAQGLRGGSRAHHKPGGQG
jgi:hypothetical protein